MNRGRDRAGSTQEQTEAPQGDVGGVAASTAARPAGDAGVRYRVLGPLAASRDGRPCSLGGRRQRTVLAVLLAHANQVVGQDALVGAVWDEDPPDAARRTLHAYVSRLRRELGEVLGRHGDGYRVSVSDDGLDAHRFARLVADARGRRANDPVAASALLAEALGLWYGSPYGELGATPALVSEVTRLEEARLSAVELRVEADVAAGEHRRVVGELEALVREHPYREKLLGLLMLALYRCGRQAEALRVYQHTRVRLVDELGIDPSAELRDLERRILTQDPRLGLAGGQRRVAVVCTQVDTPSVVDPDELAPSLAQYRAVFDEVVVAAGGRVVGSDSGGSQATFDQLTSALDAARLVCERVAAASTGLAGHVAAAIAVDVVEVAGPGHGAGVPVGGCAALAAAGHGGQVLVSAEAYAALKDGEVAVSVRELGPHRVAGASRPQPVFQLEIPELPSDFPPLHVDRRPTGLGRELARSVRGYELREPVGEGDYGVVYRAFQPTLGREVAVKAIRPEYVNSPAFVRRFEAEARLVAQLEHPHIVGLHDFWRDPDGAYLVMPFLTGGCLADGLRRGPWNLAPALRLLEQVGSAIGYAHRQGVIHRDVKPSNVLLDDDGNAYLSDFGIASRLIDDAGTPVTTSLAYLPPEEVSGAPLTARSDIYSLGVLAAQLLTGINPDGRGPVASLTQVRGELPAAVAAVLGRATADDPANRFERVDDLLRALRRAVGADVVALPEPPEPVQPVAPARNPYKGLRAFLETDALDFNGRDALIDELLHTLADSPLVAVVGPSGSGKSSVVRAGLIPALRAGGLPGSRGWLVTDMFPGSYPFEELEAALLRVAVTRPSGLVDELVADDRGLLRISKQILPADDSLLVLVIDQFEELFSAVTSEEVRRRFLASLVTVAADERSRLRVVLTLRADFFDRPLEYPAFAELIGASLVTVAPPSEEGLAQAIAAPARGVGVDLEPGLVGRIIADVRDQPGGLPLLQFALTEMFARRADGLLTIDGYEATGGVLGALGRRAEELYGQLPPDGQQAARQLFLRLVTVDDNAGSDTRRRVRQSELKTLAVERVALDRVIQQFGAFRLLSFDRDPATRGPTVEVAHEALLREWDRLAGWIDDHRDELTFHRRLVAAVREWVDADRDASFLLRGGRLEHAERWALDSSIALSGDEADYLTASREQHDLDQATARRRRRRTIAGLATALLAVAILAVFALLQRQIAEQEARDATARRLAGDSTLALDHDPELATLLALESAELSRQAGVPLLPETVAAMHQAVQTSRVELTLGDGRFGMDFSPDGTLIATDSTAVDAELGATSDVVLWDAASGAELARLPGDGQVDRLVFSPDPDSGLLAVGYHTGFDEGVGEFRAGTEISLVVLWDVTSRQQIARLPAPPDASDRPWPIVWSPEGEQLAALSHDDARDRDIVTVWQAGSGATLSSFEAPGKGGSLAFLNARTLLIPDHQGIVRAYDAATGEYLAELDTGLSGDVYFVAAIDRDRELLVLAGAEEAQVQAWDLQSREPVWSVPSPSRRLLDISPDGRRVAVTGFDGEVVLLDADEGGEAMRLAGHTGAVWAAAFDPTGSRLVTLATGETRMWDVSVAGPTSVGTMALGHDTPERIDLAPGGREAVVFADGGTVLKVDVLRGKVTDRLGDQWPNDFGSVAWDNRLVATLDGDGNSWLRNLDGGEVVSQLPACTVPKAFSPDGSALALDGIRQSALKRLDPEAVARLDTPCQPPTVPVEALRSRVVDVVSGHELLDIGRHRIGPVVFNPHGTFASGRYLVANLEEEGALEIYDIVAREPVNRLEFDTDWPLDITFDPTGSYLAGGTQNGVAWVLDFAALVDGAPRGDALIFEQTVDTGGIPRISLNADGVLATSAFGSLRLWDIHSGRLLLQLALEAGSLPITALSHDGDYLLYSDHSGTGSVIRRLPLHTDALVELARHRVTRNLTGEECLRYLDPSQCS